VPEIDDMHLAEAGLEWDPLRGIKVNEYLQSVSNPAVYAAGDAAAGPDAGETINIFAMAIRNGLTATGLKDTICAYPTLASDVKYMV